jgi:HECT-domain (ubiquitin-transferase)
LIPTPNAKMNTGVNREMYVPNPKATSSAETQMFEFLGKLFGIAIRNKENLNLSIASVVWKRIVGEEADASDLAAIDQNSVSYITLIRDAKESDAIFTQDTQYFVCDGAELKPGGSSIPLTFANRNEYADLFVAHRLHQFDERIDVIIRGMACMIPVRVLSLFSASEVEEMVCGSTVINTDQLKKHTTYEGCAETDSHIQ